MIFDSSAAAKQNQRDDQNDQKMPNAEATHMGLSSSQYSLRRWAPDPGGLWQIRRFATIASHHHLGRPRAP